MNQEEVKEALYEVAVSFFVGASVIWAEQNATRPKLPYVTLKVGTLQRTTFPVISLEGVRYYPCRTTAEINLYTRGKRVSSNRAGEEKYSNTAASDLMDFFNYIESEEITNVLARKGVEVSLFSPVRDLTELQNDSSYRYRAMAEATISFAQEADGPYGIGGMPEAPNSSGGGSLELVEAKEPTIEEIELTERLETDTEEPEGT